MNKLTTGSLILAGALLPATAAAQVTWLASGSGDGFAAFPVGPFGEISAVGGSVGTWDPTGPEPNVGTIYNTFLTVSDRAVNAVSPVGHTLYQPHEFATANILGSLPTASVNLAELGSGPTSRVTKFDLPAFPGLSVTLTQLVSGSSTLVQTYVFQNASATSQTLTLARFSDTDLELGGGAYTDNYGYHDAAGAPLTVSISDVSQTYWSDITLGGAVVAEGARVYMRLANAGGGAHDRVPTSSNLGHPANRLIFEACVYGATAAYSDCGTLTDLDGDGVTDMTGDLGVTIQGTLAVPAGGSATAIVTHDLHGCPDADLDGTCDATDNCTGTFNPTQGDADADGLGDACDLACVSIARPFGSLANVVDAQIAWDPTDPTKASTNFGAITTLNTGTSGTQYRQVLLQYDLSSLPAGASIQSATLNMRKATAIGALPIQIHPILVAWGETTVTWNSLGGAFGPAIASFLPTAVPTGAPTAIDLTAQTQAWHAGTAPNHGVLLDQPGGARATFGSSDAWNVISRPVLDVCYYGP